MTNTTCSRAECGSPIFTRDVCVRHYHQMRRAGDLKPLPRHSVKDIDKDALTGVCAICGPVELSTRERNGRRQYECLIARRIGRRTRNPQQPDPEGSRRRRLWRMFKLTEADFEQMISDQDGRCAICGTTNAGPKKQWAIDHDHDCCPEPARSCGKCIRGLLCFHCNSGLGMFRDNPQSLANAIDYLSRTSSHSRKGAK